MASDEREPITGSGGRAPSGVQGQSPWSEGQGAKPPEAESMCLSEVQMGCKLTIFVTL